MLRSMQGSTCVEVYAGKHMAKAHGATKGRANHGDDTGGS